MLCGPPGANPMILFTPLKNLQTHPKSRQHALIKKIFDLSDRMQCPKVFMELLFPRGAISNLGTLFYTALKLKKFYRIGFRCVFINSN